MKTTLTGAGTNLLDEARRESVPRLDPLAHAPTSPPAGTRRIRVVHCLDGFGAGGTELNAVRTLERLDRDRFEVRLVTLTADGPLRPRFDAAGIPVHAFPIPNMYGPAAVRQAWRIVRLFRSWRPDVVHCHDRYTNVFVSACAHVARVPAVITSRRWWNAMPRRGYALANRLAYRASERVVVNTRALAALVRETEGVPAARVVVTPNFLDDAAFEPMAHDERRCQLEAFGVPEGSLVVGIVSRLRPEKDIGSLIRAVARLAPRFPSLHLLVVGDGPCEQELARVAGESGVAARVHFAGHRPNRPNPHFLFDVSVLCSLHEGSPNSIIEAMAAARPVVATRVGGIPDLVEDGATGLLVPPSEPDALADAIGTLLSDEGRRAAFGEAARRAAMSNHHERSVLPALEALYESLCDGRDAELRGSRH